MSILWVYIGLYRIVLVNLTKCELPHFSGGLLIWYHEKALRASCMVSYINLNQKRRMALSSELSLNLTQMTHFVCCGSLGRSFASDLR